MLLKSSIPPGETGPSRARARGGNHRLAAGPATGYWTRGKPDRSCALEVAMRLERRKT